MTVSEKATGNFKDSAQEFSGALGFGIDKSLSLDGGKSIIGDFGFGCGSMLSAWEMGTFMISDLPPAPALG